MEDEWAPVKNHRWLSILPQENPSLIRSGPGQRVDTIEAVNIKTRQAYNLAAQKYHELFQDEMRQKAYDRDLLDLFVSSLDQASLVCDAGCGPSGHIGRYVSDKGIPVLGIDISDRCIQLARENNPGMRFVHCDMGAMPFMAEIFDGIIAYYSIIDTPKAHVGMLFREFRRVLKPGGRLLIAVKVGTTEGYLPDLLGIEAQIYLTLFTRFEIRQYYQAESFTLEFFEQRDPYDFEISSPRIFAIGKKDSQRDSGQEDFPAI